MAMTKAEKARVEELEKALRLARALRLPDYPKPASMTRDEITANLVPGGEKYGRRQKVAFGYFYNTHSVTVSRGCSDGMTHSWSGDVTTTKNMGVMYSDEADAWRAVRHELTEKYARQLADIDARISALVAQKESV
jgi:hypothetical protein